MPVDDLWYLRQTGPDGRRLASKRHGRGRRWRVRYVDDQGRDRTRLFTKKGAAEVFDASVQTDVNRGLYLDPASGREKVRVYGDRWAAAQLYRHGTADRVERTLRLHVYPVLGDHQLGRVRASHVQAWVKGLALAPSSARVVYSVLASLFASAVRDRLIASSPCTGITLPELHHAEHLILTPAQVMRLAEVTPARYRAAVWLGAGCGLRVSEVLGLEVGHVQHLRREVEVRQQIAVIPGHAPHLAPTKTRTSRRTVELPNVTAAAVARHLELFAPAALDLVDRTDPRRERTRPAALLFTTESGQPLTRSAFGHVFRAAREDAELPDGVGFHALRHYFASLLVTSGASVKTVQLALGHSSPMITLNTYVGLWPEALDRTRSLVDAAFDAVPGTAVSS